MYNLYFQEMYNKILTLTYSMYALILIPIFILYSIGLYKLAKNQNIQNAWLAWMPVGNYYILGLLIKDAPYIKNKFKKIEIIALICGAVYALANIIPLLYQTQYMGKLTANINTFITSPAYMNLMIISLIVVLISICTKAFIIFMYYHLFKIYAPYEATLYTVLCVFSYSFVFLFSIRDYKKTTT